MIKDHNNNIINNITNDVPVAGTDLFADSEDFLNELTDSELVQIVGGNSGVSLLGCQNDQNDPSNLSVLLCQ
ncbi:MAG: hypothetical protein KME30_00610 [Iphinoe sp. HA4291-MV1]|jgi:hypothetical protein|nr:hypothetical protein [Iphinoe sp. HA4291-MV1]